MATCNLNTKIVMRHDTPQAWNDNNPILLCGEIGCAIDPKTGISTIKIGDGIHHWRDLEMRLGERESSTTYASGYYSHTEGHQNKTSAMQNSFNEMQEAMKKLQHAASAAGVSMTEAATALGNIYKSCQGNAESINAINTLEQKTQEPLVKMAQALKEEKRLPKNPYLEDFEIPHYDFEDMDIKNLIDF